MANRPRPCGNKNRCPYQSNDKFNEADDAAQYSSPQDENYFELQELETPIPAPRASRTVCPYAYRRPEQANFEDYPLPSPVRTTPRVSRSRIAQQQPNNGGYINSRPCRASNGPSVQDNSAFYNRKVVPPPPYGRGANTPFTDYSYDYPNEDSGYDTTPFSFVEYPPQYEDSYRFRPPPNVNLQSPCPRMPQTSRTPQNPRMNDTTAYSMINYEADENYYPNNARDPVDYVRSARGAPPPQRVPTRRQNYESEDGGALPFCLRSRPPTTNLNAFNEPDGRGAPSHRNAPPNIYDANYQIVNKPEGMCAIPCPRNARASPDTSYDMVEPEVRGKPPSCLRSSVVRSSLNESEGATSPGRRTSGARNYPPAQTFNPNDASFEIVEESDVRAPCQRGSQSYNFIDTNEDTYGTDQPVYDQNQNYYTPQNKMPNSAWATTTISQFLNQSYGCNSASTAGPSNINKNIPCFVDAGSEESIEKKVPDDSTVECAPNCAEEQTMPTAQVETGSGGGSETSQGSQGQPTQKPKSKIPQKAKTPAKTTSGPTGAKKPRTSSNKSLTSTGGKKVKKKSLPVDLKERKEPEEPQETKDEKTKEEEEKRLEDTKQDSINMLSVAISTVMLLAADIKNIPENYISWTYKYLKCIKNCQGQHPANITKILKMLGSGETNAASKDDNCKCPFTPPK